MNRCMHLDRIGVPVCETFDRGLASVRRAIVGYPKHPARRSIGLLAHDKVYQVTKALYSSFISAQAKNLCMLNVPGGHVGQSPFPFILVLHTTIATGLRGTYRHQTMPRLNAGFLIGRYHKILAVQRLAVPNALIQIKNFSRFLLKIRISWPNPTAVTPRANGILAQPAPDGFSADRSDNALLGCLLSNLFMRKPGKWEPELLWQLA